MIRKDVIFRNVDVTKLRIKETEISARLGFPFDALDREFKEELPALLSLSSPKYAAVKLPITAKGEGMVSIEDYGIRSLLLRKNLTESDFVYILAVTLGVSVDRELNRLSMVSEAKKYVFDAMASALCEALCDFAEEELLGNERHPNRFSPGYGDLSLSVENFILNRLSAETLLGIKVTQGNMMVPMKSVTAIIGCK